MNLFKPKKSEQEGAKKNVGGAATASRSLNPKKVKRKAGQGLDKASSGGGKFILFLGDDGGILVMIQGGKVTRRLFAASPEPEHIKSFLDLIRDNKKLPIYVQVDMVDQSYVCHTIPPVSAMGVGKLVQRRLDRDFAPEDVKGALPIGRDKIGRKEWNFLLISLANSAILQVWMDLVISLPNRFKGMYLVPVESQNLVITLSQELNEQAGVESSPWQLLVTHNKVSGFRQIVLKDGKLIFTRLTHAPLDTSSGVLAGSIEQEVSNTIEYLRRLSYDDKAGLDLFIIAAQEICDQLDSSKFRARNLHILTPYLAGLKLGLENAVLSADRFGDVIIAAAFGFGKKPRLKLIPNAAKKVEKIYQARMGMRLSALLILVVLLILSVTTGLSIYEVSSEKQKAQERGAIATADLAKIQRDLESLGDDTNQLIAIASLFSSMNPDSLSPLIFVSELKELVRKIATGYVSNIDWERVLASEVPKLNLKGVTNTDDMAQIKFTFVFTGHNNRREILEQQVEEVTQGLKEHFSGFDVKEEPRAGEGQSQQLTIDFNNLTEEGLSVMKQGENEINYIIIGPILGKSIAGR